MTSSEKKCVVYPGSFDPLTYGHVDLVERALEVFDEVIVAVARNFDKRSLFTFEERVEMLGEVLGEMEGVTIDDFDCLTVEYAKQKGAVAIVRGLRAVADFEYELQMALTNRKLSPEIETIFLMPSESYSFLSSTLVKEIASYGGDLSSFVPPPVERRLREKCKR